MKLDLKTESQAFVLANPRLRPSDVDLIEGAMARGAELSVVETTNELKVLLAEPVRAHHSVPNGEKSGTIPVLERTED